MGLKEDAKKIINDLFGPEVAKQVDVFEDPERYPSDFLNQCVYFLEKFIGTEAAERKFSHLRRKYHAKRGKK